MSLKEFDEKFTYKLTKLNEADSPHLSLSLRRDFSDTSNLFYPIRLKPHLTERNANPNAAKHWLYCKHLCLFLLPCETISDLLPKEELSDDGLKDYWIKQYDILAADQSRLPKWVRAYHNKYHPDREEHPPLVSQKTKATLKMKLMNKPIPTTQPTQITLATTA